MQVEPDGGPVDLPFRPALSATGRATQQRSQATMAQAPRLLLEVEGWHPAYPVALDRLGIFFRTIRLRSKTHEMAEDALVSVVLCEICVQQSRSALHKCRGKQYFVATV